MGSEATAAAGEGAELTVDAAWYGDASDVWGDAGEFVTEQAAALVSGVLQNATTLTKALTQQFTADGVVTASPLQVEAINTKPSAVSSTVGGGCGVGCVGGIIGGVFGVCVILGCVVLRRAKKMPIKSPIKSAAA